MKKKVAIIKSQVFKIGGLEKYSLELASAFSRRDCQVSLLSSGEPYQCEIEDNFEIINLRKLWGPSVLRIQQFYQACEKYLKENDFDIVFGLDRTATQSHYRAGNGVHAAYMEQKRPSQSLLKRCLSKINPLQHLILKIEKEIFENPGLRCLFCNSDMVKKQLLNYYNIDPQKIIRIHNGVEWKKWQDAFNSWQEDKEKMALEYGLSPHSHQFLFLGNDFRRKGLQYSLKALEKFKDENWQLSVIGKDKHMQFFKNLCEELKIKNRVKFFGSVTKPISFYQIADTLLIPSIYDPFANVTVEALAMGLNVVSSRQNGGSEVLNDENGWIVENIFEGEELKNCIGAALERKKTSFSANSIRSKTQSMDFSHKIEEMVDISLNS